MKKGVILLFITAISACQTVENSNTNRLNSSPEIETSNTGLSADDGTLDLSQSSLDQQKKERDLAKKLLLEAKNERVIIAIDKNELKQPQVNIVSFARNSLIQLGEPNFSRSFSFKFNSNIECRKFKSSDDAQRYFLMNGGPTENPKGLDPDGDGFACQWNPETFRKLTVPEN